VRCVDVKKRNVGLRRLIKIEDGCLMKTNAGDSDDGWILAKIVEYREGMGRDVEKKPNDDGPMATAEGKWSSWPEMIQIRKE